jgi:hypothetical protein
MQIAASELEIQARDRQVESSSQHLIVLQQTLKALQIFLTVQ